MTPFHVPLAKLKFFLNTEYAYNSSLLNELPSAVLHRLTVGSEAPGVGGGDVGVWEGKKHTGIL